MVKLKVKKIEVEGDDHTQEKIGDIHLGHINCDKDALSAVIDFAKSDECDSWLGMGDYGDAIIPNDPRFDYRSIDMDYKTPQEQYSAIEEMFEPIAHKCVGLLDGNHDILHWKKYQHNYVEEMAKNLGVDYLTVDAYIRLHFAKFDANYDIFAHHGWTGSRTKGGKISRIYDLPGIFPMCDEYDMGHVHDLGIADKQALLYVDDDLEIRDKLSIFLFTGSFLRAYKKGTVSYVEEKTYRPTILGSPIITIMPYKGRATTSFDVKYGDIRRVSINRDDKMSPEEMKQLDAFIEQEKVKDELRRRGWKIIESKDEDM